MKQFRNLTLLAGVCLCATVATGQVMYTVTPLKLVSNGKYSVATAINNQGQVIARFDAAIAHIREARVLDPLSYTIGNDLALALECAGRYDAAIASARQTLRNDPLL